MSYKKITVIYGEEVHFSMNKRKPLLLLVTISLILSIGAFSFVSAQEESLIPVWIKTAVGFWVDDVISDEEFLKAIEYFVEHEIIKVPSQTINDKKLINELQIFQTEINTKIEKLGKLGNIPQIQETLAESNDAYTATGYSEQLMKQIDERWQSSDPDVPDSIAFNLIHNPSGEVLRSIMDMDKKSTTKFKIAEIFVTNQYGANVAQSHKTSDYRQDDEEWWQKAKENSVFLSSGGFDESAGVYSSDIAIKILDEDGNFVGVLKAVIDLGFLASNFSLEN